ncbi:MAG: polysaccharide pyruvyl transferase family protein [Sphingomonadaceae bacterium]|nr:polysaccharide pyruvyl transferase family protein [Sphingomonadaceae bacterium]
MIRRDIGLLWHSDRSGNLGVGALTVGNIALVREVAAGLGIDPHFVILGFNDAGVPYVNDDRVRFEPFSTRSALAFARTIGRMDAVLDIGAGDSFTDLYPAKRLAWIVLSKVAAIAQRVPLVFSPQTIGPFTGGTAAKRRLGALARWTMRRARAVVVRDDRSRDAVRAMVPGVEPVYSVDVAFALPWTPLPPVPGKRRIGLNVSGLLWRGGYTGRGEFDLGYDYKALMEGVIEALLADDSVSVELIAHVRGGPGSPDDDGSLADELKARWPALVRVPDFASPSAAKSHIAGLDALVGARMHACIAAFSSGVAVVPVSYSRKFEGLFGSLGYTRLVPHRGMDTAAARALVLDALAVTPRIREEVTAALTHVDARLEAYRAVLRDLFTARVTAER